MKNYLKFLPNKVFLFGMTGLVIIIISILFIAFSGQATLSWNKNLEPNLAGYNIYYGLQPRRGDCPAAGYSQKIDVGNSTSSVIKNLLVNSKYYFSVTSYNTSAKESCFSAEVSKIVSDSLKF